MRLISLSRIMIRFFFLFACKKSLIRFLVYVYMPKKYMRSKVSKSDMNIERFLNITAPFFFKLVNDNGLVIYLIADFFFFFQSAQSKFVVVGARLTFWFGTFFFSLLFASTLVCSFFSIRGQWGPYKHVCCRLHLWTFSRIFPRLIYIYTQCSVTRTNLCINFEQPKKKTHLTRSE